MTSLKSVKIIDHDEASNLIPRWPADVSFSSKFGQLHSKRHGFESGYVVVTYVSGFLLLPIQWGAGKAYSVYKGHTMPVKIGDGLLDPQWYKIAVEIRRLTKSNLYIADLALPEAMAQGIKSLPSAVFTLNILGHTIETLFPTFNKTTRNLIRRSQEQGFRIEVIYGRMTDDAYKLYVDHQESMGTPPRSKKYFDDVAEVFGDGFLLFCAYDKGLLIGMNLVWCAERGVWLSINSSVFEYNSRHVNYLLYYEMIKWACENNIDRVDFGGSSTRDGNVHNTFKLGFGAHMTPILRLINGTSLARFDDWRNRKERNLRIRWNKLWNLIN